MGAMRGPSPPLEMQLCIPPRLRRGLGSREPRDLRRPAPLQPLEAWGWGLRPEPPPLGLGWAEGSPEAPAGLGFVGLWRVPRSAPARPGATERAGLAAAGAQGQRSCGSQRRGQDAGLPALSPGRRNPRLGQRRHLSSFLAGQWRCQRGCLRRMELEKVQDVCGAQPSSSASAARRKGG